MEKDPSRVWNIHETGLFWRALPRRTLARVDQRLSGSKTQKDRITFTISVSVSEEKLPLHGIVSSRTPRAIANVRSTPAAVLGGQRSHNQ